MALSTVVAAAIGLLLAQTMSEKEIGIITAAMLWALFWFGLTPLIWRETKQERAARLRHMGGDAIACPACGYNMSGLKEVCCPECGARYTIDQFFAAVREQVGELR